MASLRHWKRAYEDKESVIFVRDGSPTAALGRTR